MSAGIFEIDAYDEESYALTLASVTRIGSLESPTASVYPGYTMSRFATAGTLESNLDADKSQAITSGCAALFSLKTKSPVLMKEMRGRCTVVPVL